VHVSDSSKVHHVVECVGGGAVVHLAIARVRRQCTRLVEAKPEQAAARRVVEPRVAAQSLTHGQ
jgi:hypothetical protein